MSECQRPVLVLGAGINGCAVARELALNRIPVVLVDESDIGFGATARSSRLVHGGLRYLEYGEVGLVRESLAERDRLLRLAPQFVRPLRTNIPVRSRLRGLATAGARLLGFSLRSQTDRGLLLVRAGLWLYDFFAGGSTMPKSSVHHVGEPGLPRVDPIQFRWFCSYYDAQLTYPERFILALLTDARQLAAANGVDFNVHVYTRANRTGLSVTLMPNSGPASSRTVAPSLIVNATGAWGDWTLRDLGVPSRQIFAGTKGSHIVTTNVRLRADLGDSGVYVQADDGRMVFILPIGECVLIGTTDEPFADRPDRAVATEHEIAFLLSTTNVVFASARLTRGDVLFHTCGVRPLPHVDGRAPAAITRRHWVEENHATEIPVFTLVGGKLTTCRSLAEQTVDRILHRLGVPRCASSRDRPVPGGDNYPVSADALQAAIVSLAQRFQLPIEQVKSIWSLVGTRCESILATMRLSPSETIDGTCIPIAFVDWVVCHEWVHSLEDLIQRRLMLLYQPRLTRRCLEQLSNALCAAGLLAESDRQSAVDRAIDRLATFHGRILTSESQAAM